MAPSEAYYRVVERRIERLTLMLGAAGAAYAGWRWGWKYAAGVAAGSVLMWLNFRWLDQGVGALLQAAAQSEGQPVRNSRWIYARFVGRMALLIGALYVIFKGAWLPGRAILAGLFTLIAGVVLELFYELATGFREPGAGS